MKLQLSSEFLYQDLGVKYGITPETIEKCNPKISDAVARVDQMILEKKYGFVNVLENVGMLEKIEQIFHSFRFAKTMVVVGIGGSDLGARAVQQALEQAESPFEVIFHGDSSDPVALDRLTARIDLDETVFCIISKSGETIETISQYIIMKSLYSKKTDVWSQHFLFITDEKKGILRQEADTHGISTLAIPDDVGGRFSVQTSVGLFPSICMGVDIRQLIDGARSVISDHRLVAQELARTQYLLNQQGIDLHILMPYSVQLEEFSRWYRQLWAESLGKENKGVLPIQARGPADQHSQVQFYTEGKLLASILFIRILERKEDVLIHDVDVKGVEYLEGHSFNEILNIEQQATALALKKLGRPSATLSLESLTPYSLGQLFLLFELAVVYLAEMFEIDAFNQPGVEEGKQMMYALMGRQGFEQKKKEIESLL